MLDLRLLFLLLIVAPDELTLLCRVLGVALHGLVAEGASKQGLVLARDEMIWHFVAVLLRLIFEISPARRGVRIVNPSSISRRETKVARIYLRLNNVTSLVVIDEDLVLMRREGWPHYSIHY